jgi:hypothetical protein
VISGVSTLGWLAAALTLFVAPPAAAGPLRTAVVDGAYTGPNHARAFAQTKTTGATMVRIDLVWRAIAPDRRPADFEPQNPNDPAYNWAGYDAAITAATRTGLDPILSVVWAPRWAEGAGQGRDGTVNPDPLEYARFARAAATRYSGTFVPNNDPYAEPLPRVRHWMAWNEPNRDYFFQPQYAGGQLVSPGLYRGMVNRFSAAIHDVHASNIVIAGGLAPLGRPGKPAPLTFMRSMLSARVEFDVWSHHPYTSGGPTHHASSPNDVALGDLPEMRAVLGQAIRRGNVVSSGKVGFWVTEFSWDSNPPDPQAVGATLHARWVSEALYRMWRSGVSVVTWFRIQDDPLRGPSGTAFQSGFYKTNGAPKSLARTAFRFPVVAFRQGRGIYVWGRTPAGVPGRIVVEVRIGRRWRQLGRLNANSYGIFARTFRTPIRRGAVRARLGREASLGFSLAPTRNRYVNPFGCGGAIPC